MPKVFSNTVGDARRGVAANRQVGPTSSEITIGNHYNFCVDADAVPVDRRMEDDPAELRFELRLAVS